VTINKSSFSPGDLVRILNVPDQPKWIRDHAGQAGLVVEAYNEGDQYGQYTRFAVMIGGTIHRGIHRLDMERVQ